MQLFTYKPTFSPFSSKPYTLLVLSLLLLWCFKVLFYLPQPLFSVSYSTIMYDGSGNLLNGAVSADGQWRFYPTNNVPEKFKEALLVYEDEWFNYHPGFNPISITKAFITNLKNRGVKRGGSTITMQVASLAQPKERTLINKFREMWMAIKLEMAFSKDEIFNLYANHAPFGGNIVGYEAASWRYFGRSAEDLSYAEAALLAVLPNSPALIRLDKNRQVLKNKRNKLLLKLFKKGYITDEMEYTLAVNEPLPDHLFKLPNAAPHLFATLTKTQIGNNIQTTIDGSFQEQLNTLVELEGERLAQKGINNCAALVINNKTGNVMGYVGNTSTDLRTQKVDIVRAPRSSGSILKPFLYGAVLNDGRILTTTLLLDIPTYYKNFTPNNFDCSFSGATKAGEALSRSLNIPAVRLLSDYTPGRFLNLLQQLNFTTINRSADNYGLSLILGGAEVTLWDVCQSYYLLAASVNSYQNTAPPQADLSGSAIGVLANKAKANITTPELSIGAAYLVLNELTNVARPAEEEGWQEFASNQKIAWKTGTSFGFKDGWAVGVTPDYTVGVWTGNANGEGNKQIVGGLAAAPILFRIFKLLPPSGWFNTPNEVLTTLKVCPQSGYKVGPNCTGQQEILSLAKGEQTALCPYHKPITLTANKQYRTTSDAHSVWDIAIENYFVLPPSVEYYYQPLHPEYTPLPPLEPSTEEILDKQLQILYPEEGATIFLPKGFSGQTENLVVKLAHRQQNQKVFWHLDGNYLTTTDKIHSISIAPKAGLHTLLVTDNNGNRLKRTFTILGR